MGDARDHVGLEPSALERFTISSTIMVLTGSDESKLRTFQGPSQDQISGYKDFNGEFHNADI